jgi:gluconolactonase
MAHIVRLVLAVAFLMLPACSSTSSPAVPAQHGPYADSGVPSTPDAAGYGDPLSGLGTPELVQGGFKRIEGPAWHDGALYFSDIENDGIQHLDEASGVVTVFRQPSGNSNGLAFDPAGLLLACEQSNHRVTRTLGNGTVEVIADHWQGKIFQAPNDITVRQDGTVYFTDPGFDFPAPAADAPPYKGVYRVAPSRELFLVADALDWPNGITLSIDEKTLYVGETLKGDVQKFPVNPDGTTGAPELFAQTALIPDGMCIDDAGNLFVTTAQAIQVFASDGSLRGEIPMPKTPQNCAFGGADRRTLYVTVMTSLYRVRMSIPGRPF